MKHLKYRNIPFFQGNWHTNQEPHIGCKWYCFMDHWRVQTCLHIFRRHRQKNFTSISTRHNKKELEKSTWKKECIKVSSLTLTEVADFYPNDLKVRSKFSMNVPESYRIRWCEESLLLISFTMKNDWIFYIKVWIYFVKLLC